jgi:hypothetical protein
MTFNLTTFGSLALPVWNSETPVGSAPSVSKLMDLPGGLFWDGDQTEQARPALPYDLTYKCDHLLADGEPLSYNYLVQNWWAVRGTRNVLTRRLTIPYYWYAYDLDQWCWARFKQVKAVREPRLYDRLPMVFEFQILSPWYGTLHDDTYELVTPDSYTPWLQSLFIVNSGSRPITNMKLTLTAGAAHILSALKVGCRNSVGTTVTEFTYTKVLSPADVVTIDCGARSVLLNGANDYASFALTANHTRDDWLWLQAFSSCYLDITRTTPTVCDMSGDALNLYWYDEYE